FFHALGFRTAGNALVIIPLILFLFFLIQPAVQNAREASVKMAAKTASTGEALSELGYFNSDEAKIAGERNAAKHRPEAIGQPLRVRRQFPETLLWRPELITDEKGVATLDLDLADSISTWRLSASGVMPDGRMGSAQIPIRVFQPFFVDFNLPVSLTRGDL